MAVLKFPPLYGSSAWWCLLAALFFAFAPRQARAQGADLCVPPPAVKAALDALPSQTPAQTDWEFHEKNLTAIQALRRQHPSNIFVQREYINFMMHSQPDREKAIEEYKAKLAQNPENPQAAYLYGLTLLGRQSRESIKLFLTALEKDPRFSWPHLSLVKIYSSPVFQDQPKSVAHLKAFLEACPASFDGYWLLARMDDKNLINQAALKLRDLLRTRSDLDAIGAYQTLWSLQFRALPPSEYDALREQVRHDLERIRAFNLQDKQIWYETLENGYKLVDDWKRSDWAKEQRQLCCPRPWELASMSKWFDEHHYPSEDSPPDKKRIYYGDLLTQSGEWLKRRPNNTSIWWARLDAMAHLDDVPPTDIEATADKFLSLAERSAGPVGLSSGDYFTVAEQLSKRHLQPERVVEMAQKGLVQLEVEPKESDDDLYATKEELERVNFYLAYQRLAALGYETDGYLQLKQSDKAQIELSRTDERLQDLKSLAGDKQDRNKVYSVELAAYWGRMGRLAELRGRKLDAMAFYENALLARLDAQQEPETGARDELADDAQRLWTSLGGTAEGWQMWYGRRADALSKLSLLTWEDVNEPLPGFELADLNGKTWNLESLKGKVTFLNFWASW